MAVEIKELVIRATVEHTTTSLGATPRMNSSQDADALVESCVKEVLKILKRSKER